MRAGSPGATEVNIFSKPGQPMIPVTYLVHFDSVAQRQLARVPLSVNCSFSGGSPPFYASCLRDFVELELPGRTNSIITSAPPCANMTCFTYPPRDQ